MAVGFRGFGRAMLAAGVLTVAAGATSAATLTPVAPFADAYYSETTLLGINNAGFTTGSLVHVNADFTREALGFMRAPDGTYTTFANAAYPAAQFTSGRAISNSNTVIGYSSINGRGSIDFRGFQRTVDGTISLLTRPADGSPQAGFPLAGISQGINDNGVIVGNYRARSEPTASGPIRNHGYILDGASFTELVDATDPLASVNARGIANDGTVVGWQSDATNGTRGWVYSGGAFAYVSHPGDADANGFGTTILEAINNNGQILGGYTRLDGGVGYSEAFMYDAATGSFTDIVVPGATSVTTWGINDSGSYVITSDAGNFIYSPDGPVAPDGSSVFLPVAGGNLPDGQSQFAITVTPNVTYYIDPALASGFEFLSGTGPLFASVVAPTGIGIDNLLSLFLWNGTDYAFDRQLTGGIAYSFATATDRFQLRGIPVAAGIGFDDHSAFITGLTFASAGQFNGFQIALGAVPEPTTWAMMIVGFGLVGTALRRRAGATEAA